MTEVVIVRHAQSVWNAVGRWQGWADPPLSELGERQATAAGGVLRARSVAPDRFVSSDLQRARRTAELLRAALATTPAPERVTGSGPGQVADVTVPGPPGPVLIDPDLREYDAGEWTGLRRAEIARDWPGQLEAWAAGQLAGPPGGEDQAGFVERLLEALGRLGTVAPGGLILAVSHGRAIHQLAAALGGPGGRVDHLSGWRIRLQGSNRPELLAAVSLLDTEGSEDRLQDL